MKNNEGILLKYWPVIVTIVGAVITVSSFFYMILNRIDRNTQKLDAIEKTLCEIKNEVRDDKKWQENHLEKYHYHPYSAGIGRKFGGLSSLGFFYNSKRFNSF